MVAVITAYGLLFIVLGIALLIVIPPEPKETEKEQADRVREENKRAESRAQYWIPIPDMRVRKHAVTGGYYQ